MISIYSARSKYGEGGMPRIAVTNGRYTYQLRCNDDRARRFPTYEGRTLDMSSSPAENFIHLKFSDVSVLVENKEKLFRILRAEDRGSVRIGNFDSTMVTAALLSQYGEEFLKLWRKISQKFGYDMNRFFVLFLENDEGTIKVMREIAKALSNVHLRVGGWSAILPVASGAGFLLPGLGNAAYVTSVGEAYSLHGIDTRLLYKYHQLGIVDRLVAGMKPIKDREVLDKLAPQIGKIRPDMVLLLS